MNLVIICGSQRKNSSTVKVAKAIKSYALNSDTVTGVNILDLSKSSIPFWDEALKKELGDWEEEWLSFSEPVRAADAVIVVSPEWEEDTLRNFFLMCQFNEYPTKPGSIVRISSTCRGAYSARDLLLNNFKNNRLCYVLEHLMIGTNEDISASGSEYNLEPVIQDRLGFTLKLMSGYIELPNNLVAFPHQAKQPFLWAVAGG